MMALEHPRLLAASLIGLFLATSCSTPPETTTPASSPSTAPAAAAPTQEPQQPQQPQPQQPDRVSDERRQALVAKYMSNAQALRSNGNLEAAKRELLKAKELSPTNEEVLTLLRSVQAELGEPPGRVSTYAEEQLRLRQIGEERALANVQAQLQKVQQMMADKNYAGAVDELRVAQLTIEARDDMDWKDLPGQVEKARVEAERLYDEQRQQSQAKQNEQAADQLRRQYAENEARRQARLEALLHEAQIDVAETPGWATQSDTARVYRIARECRSIPPGSSSTSTAISVGWRRRFSFIPRSRFVHVGGGPISRWG